MWVTAAYAIYTFPGLAAGSYRVLSVDPEGWLGTAPAAGLYVVPVLNGQTVAGRDFGQQHATADNRPPHFTSTVPTAAAPVDVPWRYDATASDADQDVLTYDLPVRPSGMAVDPYRGSLLWQPRPEKRTQLAKTCCLCELRPLFCPLSPGRASRRHARAVHSQVPRDRPGKG
jgi:hypothetical protein